MEAISKKIYLNLEMPDENAPVSDAAQIKLALKTLGFFPVSIPVHILRKLYPLCRNAGFDITVSLVKREWDWILTDVEAGNTVHQHFGLAVDYGSTTIVAQLVDLNSGAVLWEEKQANGQIAFGTDILSRITYAMEDPSHKEDLHNATIATFRRLLDAISEGTGIQAGKCPVMILSGNTTMIHFLLKLDAWTVFSSPYAPITSDPGFFWGSELELPFEGQVYIIPAASNYVGGDIVSGLLSMDMHKQEKVSLFFDIGTNGELVLGNRDWLFAGAGAAGPALEGYISRYGMRAGEGTIDSVKIRGKELHFTTIGDKRPIGICGSGIIDLIAQMRMNGWINIAGELNPEASPRIRNIGGELAAVYADSEESASGELLYFSQTDINQYLDTKAAAYTMVECLMESAGITFEELDRCYLSGAFPAHCDLESAITIGIFPDLPQEKFQILRNSSLDGARMILLDCSQLDEIRNLPDRIFCVQFASIPDFLVRMQAAKFIPHTDMDRYPRIQERLRMHKYLS